MNIYSLSIWTTGISLGTVFGRCAFCHGNYAMVYHANLANSKFKCDFFCFVFLFWWIHVRTSFDDLKNIPPSLNARANKFRAIYFVIKLSDFYIFAVYVTIKAPFREQIQSKSREKKNEKQNHWMVISFCPRIKSLDLPHSLSGFVVVHFSIPIDIPW